jgi:hypothetical protein
MMGIGSSWMDFRWGLIAGLGSTATLGCVFSRVHAARNRRNGPTQAGVPVLLEYLSLMVMAR